MFVYVRGLTFLFRHTDAVHIKTHLGYEMKDELFHLFLRYSTVHVEQMSLKVSLAMNGDRQ